MFQTSRSLTCQYFSLSYLFEFQLTNEVTVDAGPGANKAATADHGAAVSKSPLPGRRRTMTSNKLPDSSRAVLPDRYTRIIAPMSSPVLSTSHWYKYIYIYLFLFQAYQFGNRQCINPFKSVAAFRS